MSTDQPPNGMPSDGTRKPGGEPAEPDPPAGEQPAPGGDGTTRPVSGPEPVPPAATPPPAGSPYDTPPSGPANSPYSSAQSGSGGTPYDNPPGGPGGTPYDSAQSGSSGSPYDNPPEGASGSPYDKPPGGSGGSPYDTPPQGSTGSPYDTPPGGANPPPGGGYGAQPPPYPGAGGAYGGSPHGEGDPRLAGMPPLGSLGKRLIARIIDGLLIGVPMAIILTAAGIGYDFNGNQVSGGWASSLLTMAAYFVYEGLMLTHDGQTVGKKLMKIRVAMLENGAIPAGNAGWIRAAVYSLPEIIPCVGFLFWLYNVLSCTWDKPYHQAVHDKVAKTVVVQAVPQPAPQQPAQHAPSQGPPPAA